MILKKHIFVVFVILGLTSSPLFGQELNFYMTSDTLLVKNTMTEYLTSNIENLDGDTLAVDIVRLENNLPESWYSGLCVDVCEFAHIDSIRVFIPPYTTKEFRMYFTGLNSYSPDTAHTKILFRNVHSSSNAFVQNYYAMMNPLLLVEDENENKMRVIIYPNPAKSHINLKIESPLHEDYSLKLYDSMGRLVRTITEVKNGHTKIERENLTSGFYIYHLQTNDHTIHIGEIIFH